jgi:hemerythrin-like domain-containing protein
MLLALPGTIECKPSPGIFYCQWPGDFSKGGQVTPAVQHNTSMLRDRNLVPLSHQHQHALALCVRIEPALSMAAADLESWQAEVEAAFEREIQFHFAAEEQVLFPIARRFADLVPLVDELIEEHQRLRKHGARAKDRMMDTTELQAFALLLSSHIHKEERQLFEAMQKFLSREEMDGIGVKLGRVLQEAVRACGLRPPES